MLSVFNTLKWHWILIILKPPNYSYNQFMVWWAVVNYNFKAFQLSSSKLPIWFCFQNMVQYMSGEQERKYHEIPQSANKAQQNACFHFLLYWTYIQVFGTSAQSSDIVLTHLLFMLYASPNQILQLHDSDKQLLKKHLLHKYSKMTTNCISTFKTISTTFITIKMKSIWTRKHVDISACMHSKYN